MGGGVVVMRGWEVRMGMRICEGRVYVYIWIGDTHGVYLLQLGGYRWESGNICCLTVLSEINGKP
jgi:hypothetical protein